MTNYKNVITWRTIPFAPKHLINSEGDVVYSVNGQEMKVHRSYHGDYVNLVHMGDDPYLYSPLIDELVAEVFCLPKENEDDYLQRHDYYAGPSVDNLFWGPVEEIIRHDCDDLPF